MSEEKIPLVRFTHCPFCGTTLDGSVEHSIKKTSSEDGAFWNWQCTVIPKGHVATITVPVELK